MGIETLITVIILLLVCGMLVWCVQRIPNMPPPILAAVEIIIVLVFALFMLGNIGIERKKMSIRDENRHLDVRHDINFRMSALIDRYWTEYGSKKKSADREISILAGICTHLGRLFVREVDGIAVAKWYERLTGARALSVGTAVRHFNVMHHMMEKACTIWSKESGIDRNPADQIEVKRPDDQRDRYLSLEELGRLKLALDEKQFQKGLKVINRTFFRLRMLVIVAVTTGMRQAEIFNLRWQDVLHGEGLLAVRSKLKGGKMRYVPMPSELEAELRRYPVTLGDDRVFPPRGVGKRQRVEGSFDDLLNRADIHDFRFHDLRHTFASWYMMNGGDLYELAKILGHSTSR